MDFRIEATYNPARARMILLKGSVRKIPDGYFFVNYRKNSMSQEDINMFAVLVKRKDAAQLALRLEGKMANNIY